MEMGFSIPMDNFKNMSVKEIKTVAKQLLIFNSELFLLDSWLKVKMERRL
jgi:hypothetical protein